MSTTLQEIDNQESSWRTTLELLRFKYMDTLTDMPIDGTTHFLFVGCGTSYYIAQSAARATQEVTGCSATAIPASEVLLMSISTVPKHQPVVVIPISRSGNSSEIILAVRHLKEHFSNVYIMGITCNEEGELAQEVPHSIILQHAAEQSIVMTQSFTSMLLALQFAAAVWSKRDDLLLELATLPDHLATYSVTARLFGEQLSKNQRFEEHIFLGMGQYTGLALEGMLKLKEMTQTPCEAYNSLEFRHGPMSIVGRGTSILLLAQRQGNRYLREVARDIRALGGYVSILTPDFSGFYDDVADEVLAVSASLSDWARTILYIPPLQYFAYFTALRKGLNPDKPRHLSQVVAISVQETTGGESI